MLHHIRNQIESEEPNRIKSAWLYLRIRHIMEGRWPRISDALERLIFGIKKD